MLAFVDESKSGSLVSIGFYISRSYIAAYEGLMDEYRKILRSLSARVRGEVKFSTILNIIGKKLGILPNIELMKIFREAVRKISMYGYGLAILINEKIPTLPRVVEDMMHIENSLARIRKLMKSRGYSPSNRTLKVLISFLIMMNLYPKISTIIVDQNFIRKKDLCFIFVTLRFLGYNTHIRFCSKAEGRGILIADFVAGLSRHISTNYSYGIIDNILVFSASDSVADTIPNSESS